MCDDRLFNENDDAILSRETVIMTIEQLKAINEVFFSKLRQKAINELENYLKYLGD